MINRSLKLFLAGLILILISCEDRIFLEREPDLILDNGYYIFESEEYSFDHVILEMDSILYTAIPCNQDNAVVFFNIDHSGNYLMSVIFEQDTIFRKSIYLNEVHNDVLKITALDVKQGDSFIISPTNELSSIIDGGYGTSGIYNWQDGGKPTLLNYLESSGNRDLKYLIETHHDMDHYGGLNDLVANSSISYDEYLTYDSQLPEINDTLFFSDDIFGIMLHYGDLPDSLETEENNRSIVLKLVYKDFEMLFAADIELEVEDYLLKQNYFIQYQNYDILKVAHHGSSSSSSEEFLNQVNPKLSIISVGEGNPWSHPTETVQGRLTDNSKSVLRTDQNGTISIFTDGNSLQTESIK